MITFKDYVIIAIVCVFTIAAIAGVIIVSKNNVETQIDILEETESAENIEATEETIPEVTDTTNSTEPTEPPTEPVVEEPESTETTEPHVKETAPTPKPTNPSPKPTEPPATEVTEPTVEETEPVTEPPIEETEPVTEPTIEETTPTEPIPEVTEPPVTEEEPEKDPYDPVELLACVIYQEAGSDYICDDCRYRVADVVLNRVADPRYPNTIYGVLTQPSQYGRYYWTGVVWPSRANNSGERHAVQRAYNIAMNVVAGTHSELYGNGYVYQAQFVQGRDNIYCCGHYFGR